MTFRQPADTEDPIITNNKKIATNNNRYSMDILTPPTELLYTENIHPILQDVKNTSNPTILLFKGYTQEAINNYRERNTLITVLNFASSIQAGGGYLTGNKTQEEALCRHTPLLYPSYCALSKTINGTSTSSDRTTINAFRNGKHYWPEWRNVWDSCIMYTRKIENYKNALSSGDYKFNVENDTFIDVIAASAPKLKRTIPGTDVKVPNDKEYDNLLGAVCKLAVINSRKRETNPVLILGAWGCGAYGNDPRTISQSFQRVINRIQCPTNFTIVFAIPDGVNYTAFHQTFMGSIAPSRPDTTRIDPRLQHSSPNTCVHQDIKLFYKYNPTGNILSLFHLSDMKNAIYSKSVIATQLKDVNIKACVNSLNQESKRKDAVYVYMSNKKYYAAWKSTTRDDYYYAELRNYVHVGGTLSHILYYKNKNIYNFLPDFNINS